MRPSSEQATPSEGRAAPETTLAELRARLPELTLRDEHRLGGRLQKLRRPNGQELGRLAGEFAQAEARIVRRRAALPAISYPPELPVSAHRPELLEAIGSNQVVVVAGETGSGKTTQLPKICLELGRGVRGAVAHTQPRRLAARTVAERIAAELDVPLGEAVGYAVRFSDRSRQDTLVRLVTDGLLLAEIQHDPDLRRYDTIIVDEAHERSLNIDFLLGYVKRLLPRRPDLKLIITSATIDPERLSSHFDGAPVVEVSGRTFPVEVRYRPLTDSPGEGEGEGEGEADGEQGGDVIDAIGRAVGELLRERRGDVLVFLSGEREIRDTADALAGRLGSKVEVLPLYARLSSGEQQRVFAPHTSQRVVLATNVAETSLTVPGIRYVVDPGTARISRYSARLKVQRLPIERISQASADQRKGRCGRTADGICIRLYAEEDFAARPRFTDPEILRTSLAAVILQMAAAGLGAIEEFPFLDPPDGRQVRDGLLLLQELGALDPGTGDAGARLTKLGRRLARLPVDPRMGRMVLEAERLGCAEEVIVIAAGLSIQDPRERPADKQAAADEQHARFADEHSDFVSYLNLWRYLGEEQGQGSKSAFRRRLRAEFINHLRVREWQDLVAQLREAAKGVGVTINQTPSDAHYVHIALLSGLLSHIGVRDAKRRDYEGARGARFAIFPGSSLARRQPAWVMVAELMETSRLWGRTAARIQPEWVEPLAEHIVKRTYDAPHWERRRAAVVALERVTLYGLPIVAGRKVAYGGIDPVLARELFIRRALVEGDWSTQQRFVKENRRRVEEVEALQDRARRLDLLVDDQVLFDFFDARLPADVVSGSHFDSWWRDERRSHPDRLTFPRELLINREAAGAIDRHGRPDEWQQGDLTLRLSYRFEPGTEHDGVSVHVPLTALGQLDPASFEWLVPAMRHELVTALIRSLPKELRKHLVPAPDTAAQAVARLEPRAGPLLEALATELERGRSVRIPRTAWNLGRLPPHLRMTFRVEDEAGELIAEGNDLDALREELRPRLREELRAATSPLERHGLSSWTLGALPRTVALPGTGGSVQGFPALVDEGKTVGVQVLDTRAGQEEAMRAGTRRLLLLSAPGPQRYVQDKLDISTQLRLATAPHGSLRAVLDDCTAAAVDDLVGQVGGPAWDEHGFVRLRDHVAGNLAEATLRVVEQVVRILELSADVQGRLDDLAAARVEAARGDIERQLGRLVPPGFVSEAGVARLVDVERYLRAALRRLERLPATAATDLDRMRAVHDLERAYERRLEAWPDGRPLPEPVNEVRWMLEELRVSHFAQGLGTRGAVSSKRIRRILDEVAAAAA